MRFLHLFFSTLVGVRAFQISVNQLIIQKSLLSNHRSISPTLLESKTTNLKLKLSYLHSLEEPTREKENSALPHSVRGSNNFLKTLWDFSRPHTLIGSALCIPAIHIFASPAGSNIPIAKMFQSIIYAIAPSLLMNLYITGLNQVTDIEIDKVNKPFLPIPSGRLSKNLAIVIISLSLILSILLGWASPCFCTSALRTTLFGSGLLGTLYSIPPFRLKRFPLLAAICILVVRGSLINVGFYAHALSATFNEKKLSFLQLPFLDLKCGLLTGYFAVFGTIIALMKDVPDIEGDQQNNIRSFTVQFGQGVMFQIGQKMMSALVWFSGFAFLFSGWAMRSNPLISIRRGLLAIISLTVGSVVRSKAKKVNTDDSHEVYEYYMFLWKIFYASYFLLPFAR